MKGTRPGATTGELGKRRRFDSEGEEIERESLWIFRRRELSKEERVKVVCKVIEIGIRTTFRNHVYQWGGDYYFQREGGPIGLKLAGVVAKMRMIHWMRRYNLLLEENKIKTYMNMIYLDDQGWAGRSLKRGVRWDSEAAVRHQVESRWEIRCTPWTDRWDNR